MKSPWAIKHAEEDKLFFIMPEVQLLNLARVEFDKWIKEELKIVEDWIKNKRCKCVENPNIQNKKISLDCEHLNEEKAKNKIIQEADNKSKRMSSALMIRRMIKHFVNPKLNEGEDKNEK